MINTLRSEWTKLTTTTAVYWTTFLLVALSLLVAGIMGRNVTPDPAIYNIPILYARDAVVGIFLFGLFITSIQAIMTVTSEYRHNYQSVTFLGTPNRIVVAIAKWVLYGFIAALLTFVTVVLCYYTAKLFASDAASTTLRVWQDDNAIRFMWAYPLIMFLIITLSQGMAWLLRQTAGAVAIMSMWILALEDLLGLIPKVGEQVTKFGPIKNMQAFASQQDIVDAPWDHMGSLYYFAAWAAGFFILGIITLRLRDA
jgi:hypothetical protein